MFIDKAQLRQDILRGGSLINTIKELQKEIREFIDSRTPNLKLIKRDVKIRKKILRKLRRINRQPNKRIKRRMTC